MYIPTLERLFNSGEDEKICRELSTTQPDDPLVDAISTALGIIRGNSAALPAFASTDHDDAHFVRLLWNLHDLLTPDATIRRDRLPPNIRTAGTEYDFIDKTCDDPWSIAKLLNFLALGRIKPTRRAAVVVTMRNDGISILEFVAHHRALGFEHIFVFSNDNADGSSELLALLAEHGIITYIDNPISRNTSPQRKAFEYSVHFLLDLRDFEWVFFADSDELLVPGPQFGFSIAAVLDALAQAYPIDPPSAICYCWKWYGGHTFNRTCGLQLERFGFSRMSPTVKSLARLADVKSMRPLHYPICKRQSFFVNSGFERIETGAISKAPVNTIGGWVNHYWNKSFEEYSVKRSRGDALDIESKKNDYLRTDKQYFSWNVPATAEHYDPPSPLIINSVRQEYERLLKLHKIREKNEQISASFSDFLQALINPAELLQRYNSNMSTSDK